MSFVAQDLLRAFTPPTFSPMRIPTLLLALTLVTTAVAADPGPFDYDQNAPLDLKEIGVEKRGNVTVRDITFVGTKEPVTAYLVTPAGAGPHAAILYVHWFG